MPVAGVRCGAADGSRVGSSAPNNFFQITFSGGEKPFAQDRTGVPGPPL